MAGRAEVDLDSLRQAPVTEILLADRTVAIVTIGAATRDAIVASLERLDRIEAKIEQRRTSLAAARDLPDRDYPAINARLDELGTIAMAGEGDDAVF